MTAPGGIELYTDASGSIDHGDTDCAGAYYGDALIDDCGVCNGDNADDLGCGCFDPGPSGCDETCGSTLEFDECGECGGDGIDEGACDCDGNTLDCADVCGGDAALDECGVCNGDGISEGTCDCDGNVDLGCGCGEGDGCLEVTLDVELSSGWTWFSLNVIADDMTVSSIFEDIASDENLLRLKSQTTITQYYEGYGWYPDDELDVTETYKVYSYSDDLLSVTGTPADLLGPVTLASGWNWISYLPQSNLDVPTALLSLLDIDENGEEYSKASLLKNQSQITNYYIGYGWYGTLVNMAPGGGYIIYMLEEGELIYVDPSDISRTYQEENEVFVSDLWNLNIHDYEFDGNMTASISLDGIKSISDDDQLALFVGDECRGYAEAMYFPLTQEYVFHLRAYSNLLNENMSLSFFDSKTGKIYEDVQNIEFISNMVYGNALNTYDLSISTMENSPFEYRLSDANPNPFNPSTTLNYYVEENGIVNVSVFDINGRLVKELTNSHRTMGEHKITWAAENQSSGVYLVRFEVNGFTQIKKIMLIK